MGSEGSEGTQNLSCGRGRDPRHTKGQIASSRSRPTLKSRTYSGHSADPSRRAVQLGTQDLSCGCEHSTPDEWETNEISLYWLRAHGIFPVGVIFHTQRIEGTQNLSCGRVGVTRLTEGTKRIFPSGLLTCSDGEHRTFPVSESDVSPGERRGSLSKSWRRSDGGGVYMDRGWWPMRPGWQLAWPAEPRLHNDESEGAWQ
jgi:hypothetical protein